MRAFLLYPLLCAAILAVGFTWPTLSMLMWLAVPALVLAVISAVHHAEVVAHRVGEPYGTLVLALSVTVIEVALVLSMMLAGGGQCSHRATRHHLRCRDDHLQWRGGGVLAGGWAAAQRAGLPH